MRAIILSLLFTLGLALSVCMYTAMYYWAPKYDHKLEEETPQNFLARFVFWAYDAVDALQERWLSRCRVCGTALASTRDLALHHEYLHSAS